MPTRWNTFPIKLKGGYVSNVARLQQGMEMPGTARFLQNFEPSVKGGYRRINGYIKFDDNPVPMGDVKVQGSGQTGNTLEVANILEAPEPGDTLTINGVSGTYTIIAGGVSFSDNDNSATLTLTTSLDSSPADQADVTFTNKLDNKIEGLHYFAHNANVYAYRNGIIWRSTGIGWTKVSTPDYGTVLVDGGSQTGSTLTVDGIEDDDYVPLAGDTFTIAGVEKVYTVLSDATVSSGQATLSIDPSLDSSPADNAAITFLNNDLGGGSEARFVDYNFNGVEHFIMVNGNSRPIRICQGNTYDIVQGSDDIIGANFVAEFKDHIFYGTEDLVTFAAPFSHNDFTVANGAGNFRTPTELTGLIIFRENLIVFCEDRVKRLTGTSVEDFQLLDILTKIGCVHPDTIQEVGADIVFLGPDGVRYLGATDRFEDFNLQLASRKIQDQMLDFINQTDTYVSTVVRKKNQYRIFRYTSGQASIGAIGYLGAQFQDQQGTSFDWAQTKAIQAYRITSTYVGEEEFIAFSNRDGYVYRMESGQNFDGTAIKAAFFTPFMALDDPHIRKTLHRINTYHDPESTFSGIISIKYDFDDPDKIQPDRPIYNSGGDFSIYGKSVYGVGKYGGTPTTLVKTMAVGSFFTVSLEYTFENDEESFILDTIMLEYATKDRK